MQKTITIVQSQDDKGIKRYFRMRPIDLMARVDFLQNMLNTLSQGSKGVAWMVRVNSNIYLTVISIEHAVEIVGLYHILKRCNIKSK